MRSSSVVPTIPELKVFRRDELPSHLACQIRCYTRVQWPFMGFENKKLWNRAAPASSTMHFCIVDDELLVAHAGVNSRPVRVGDQTLNVYGLSTVFTYPDYRKSGHARTAVQAATDYVKQSNDADVAMLFCGQPLRNFYSSCGWEPTDAAHILYGEEKNPTRKSDNLVMMLFVSDHAHALREILASQPIYVGPQTW